MPDFETHDEENIMKNRWNILDLRSAEMREAFFEQADLIADLRGADISLSNVRGANLTGSDLSHATVKGAKLRCARLHIRAVGANFRDADLTAATIGGDWSWADLRGANLVDAVLMPGLRWDGIRLTGAIFSLDTLEGNAALLRHALVQGARILWERESPDGMPDTSDLPF